MKILSQILPKRADQCLFFKMALSTRGNGIKKLISVMVEVIKFGQTVAFMKGIGKMTKLMAEEGLFMLMVIFMTVTGKMIRLMALVNTPTQMEPNMRVTGLMTSNMEKERKIGLMVPNMKEIINMEKKTGLDLFFGQTNHLTRVIL